jgi:hypothetical protein
MEVTVQTSDSKTRRFFLVPMLLMVFFTVPIFGLSAQKQEKAFVPKDPHFARRIGFFTGIMAPLSIGLSGTIIASTSNGDGDGDDSNTAVGLSIATIGLLVPPLGNLYAGELNKKVAILYGAGNVVWIAGIVSYYWKGEPDEPPNVFEALSWLLGFSARLTAGGWDWLTASDTAIRRNAEKRNISQKSYVTVAVEPDRSRIGIRLNKPFW